MSSQEYEENIILKKYEEVETFEVNEYSYLYNDSGDLISVCEYKNDKKINEIYGITNVQYEIFENGELEKVYYVEEIEQEYEEELKLKTSIKFKNVLEHLEIFNDKDKYKKYTHDKKTLNKAIEENNNKLLNICINTVTNLTTLFLDTAFSFYNYFNKKNKLTCGVCYEEYIKNEIKHENCCNCSEPICDKCIKIITINCDYKCPYCRNINTVIAFEGMQKMHAVNENETHEHAINRIEVDILFLEDYILEFEQQVEELRTKRKSKKRDDELIKLENKIKQTLRTIESANLEKSYHLQYV